MIGLGNVYFCFLLSMNQGFDLPPIIPVPVLVEAPVTQCSPSCSAVSAVAIISHCDHTH